LVRVAYARQSFAVRFAKDYDKILDCGLPVLAADWIGNRSQSFVHVAPPRIDVILKLKSPYRDGTTHLVMTGLEFMQKLAALVPRPRLNLIRYHGVLAPNAKWRSQIVPQVIADPLSDLAGEAPIPNAPK